MNFILQRFNPTDFDTIGIFMDEDETFICFTLEDEGRQTKVPGETRIPAGTYDLVLEDSPKLSPAYGKYFPNEPEHPMVTIANVKGFTGIRMHPGTDEKDTDGCPLVAHGVLTHPPAKSSLIESRNCYINRFYPMVSAAIKAGKCTITVIDPPTGKVLP